jgi:hypothetical protein
VEGYVFDRANGTQMAFWTCAKTASSAEDVQRHIPDSLSFRYPVNPGEDFQLNHLVLAFLVAARFADPIVSLNRINSPATG